MNVSEWITLVGISIGLVIQFLMGAYFFGRIDESVRGLRTRMDGVDNRFVLNEARLNLHGERLSRLEGRAGSMIEGER